MKENDHIQNLDDSQLDGVVGGTDVPQPLTKYLSTNDSNHTILGFHIETSRHEVSGKIEIGSQGHCFVPAEKFVRYLKNRPRNTVISFRGHNEQFTPKQLLAYYK